MKSTFVSQKCMEFSHSRFVAQKKCMKISNSRFVVRRPSCLSSSSSVRHPSRSSVVVVLCPSVRPVRPSSSSPTCKSKAACKFSKEKRRNRGREYEIRIELEIWNSIAGGKLLCVLNKLVLRPKHFCFRILVPMSILTFWILYKMMIK